MMLGQIESYISLLNVNSPKELFNRVEILINNLPDGDNKTRILSSYLIKKNQINKEKSFIAKRDAIEKIEIIPERVQDKRKMFLEKKKQDEINDNKEIDRKIQEYLKYKKNSLFNKKSNYLSSFNILINAFNLIRLSKINIVLFRTNIFIKQSNIKKDVKEKSFIPTLPIFEEIKKVEQIYGIMPYGVYIGKNNIRWIIEETCLKKEDEYGKIISQNKYKIDNYVMSIFDVKGNIKLLTFKNKEHGNYEVYDNNKLIDSISYMGKII